MFDAARPARLNRSQLSVPGSQRRFLEKAAASAADIVMLDLEDSVASSDKPAARETVIAALNELDWGQRTVSVRINALDTPFMYRDLIEVAERGGNRLDLIMVPKINSAADVHLLDVLLSQIEAATGRKRLGLELQIETAEGLTNVEAIAAASPRVESLHFGPGDFAASIGARSTSIGGPVPDYAVLADADAQGARARFLGDPWHYALARIVVACRAAGVRPVDGPYGDFNDPEGLEAAARRSAAMGFDGKWAIHPSQIEPLNAAFRPSPAEIDKAKRILAALDEASAAGRGAVVLDGKMIDIASVRQAQGLVEKARRIGLA
ncbi:HpcH/HpaI aldolase/citrate lyase family protein [Phenylobacterium aquaticum]|uniref:HpcH/HpaI aldolase/citrate lyase family protein n=1 Tax=Phenylobacterium aquaticum TaxID=1763816 RepID=UPI001F5D4942|nr:CoA ester lyase [Phenylobacterium aquaticum]MCI3133493.1 CoA ester lyase [Phenylobacterium aquaticum]